MIPRIVLPILFALAICMPRLAEAETKAKPRATPAHHHTVIESVSATSITVSSAAGSKTYKITKDTEITFKGDTTTVDQLQTGMRVQVTPDAADENTAGKISANDPPPRPQAPRRRSSRARSRQSAVRGYARASRRQLQIRFFRFLAIWGAFFENLGLHRP